jgi:hypothetical protein
MEEVLGARFITMPTRGSMAIKLANYGIVDHRSLGCKMYITKKGEGNSGYDNPTTRYEKQWWWVGIP